jgi:hypothetical protein
MKDGGWIGYVGLIRKATNTFRILIAKSLGK